MHRYRKSYMSGQSVERRHFDGKSRRRCRSLRGDQTIIMLYSSNTYGQFS